MQTLSRSQTAAALDGAMNRRLLTDTVFKHLMSVGGIGVIIAISAIFFYLASVVVPLFMPPEIERQTQFAVPGDVSQATGALSGEEQREIGARIGSAGNVTFFRFDSGEVLDNVSVAIPPEASVTSFALAGRSSFAFAYGLSDGRVIVAKQEYKVTFPNDRRLITPGIVYPLGEQPIQLDTSGKAITRMSIQHGEGGTSIAAQTADNRLLVSAVTVTTNLMTGEARSTVQQSEITGAPGDVRQILIEARQREMLLLHGERSLTRYDISDKANPRLMETLDLLPQGERVAMIDILSGGFSVIVGTDSGKLSQWFPVRGADNIFSMKKIRDFDAMPAGITAMAPELFRKGFVVGDAQGNLGSYFATSRRTLFVEKLSDQPLTVLSVPPRGNGYLALDAKARLHTAVVHNDYPEVSFHSLWQKVWYESYEGPDHVWQSSAANSEFEPKFSLAPLTFGTLKAAFYAMLVAVPLALLGAIFTAYFMSARMRTIVKPTIEVMEALPTVILGFLAGLWLAPLVENNLAGVLLSILFLPVCMVGTGWLWHLLPEQLTQKVAPGWEAAFMLPVLAILFWFFFQIGHPIEAMFFNGDMPGWLSNEMGISYEQRNSLVVGIAMGFAVTPTIFSIAEDAIFTVPKHLSSGSLALGATPWQTLIGVVLLTASPGIFSAVMIGLGRAVGETMIVLMATGNTAIMDFSVFTGFRTLSANIGVEMPEAGVGETHYRLLFMSALVLFAFTFVVNTVAELVRQRMREKYSTI